MIGPFMRALVDIPDDQIDALAKLAKREGVSRAEVIRRAISKYTAVERVDPDEARRAAFGMWADKGEDGMAYQERLRSEW
jgi:hypothetical protein